MSRQVVITGTNSQVPHYLLLPAWRQNLSALVINTPKDCDNVLKPDNSGTNYAGIIRFQHQKDKYHAGSCWSIASPGLRKPWYSLYSIKGSLSSMCHPSEIQICGCYRHFSKQPVYGDSAITLVWMGRGECCQCALTDFITKNYE